MKTLLDISGRSGYRTPQAPYIRWRGMEVDGPWSHKLEKEYLERNINLLGIVSPAKDCSFIPELPHLQHVYVDSRSLRQDSALFDNPTIRHLLIYRGARGAPVYFNRLRELSKILCYEKRTNLESIRGLQELLSARIFVGKEYPDASWLQNLPSLWDLQITGEGQNFELDGLLDRLPSLLKLHISGFNLRDLRGIHGDSGTGIRELSISRNSSPLTLTELENLPSLRRVHIDKVTSLELSTRQKKTLGYVTIDHVDGASADDGDDEISISEVEDGYEVYMAIGVPGDAIWEARFGQSPSGQDWENLLDHLVYAREPALRGRYIADSESDTFSVLAVDRESALKVKDLLTPYAAGTTDLPAGIDWTHASE